MSLIVKPSSPDPVVVTVVDDVLGDDVVVDVLLYEELELLVSSDDEVLELCEDESLPFPENTVLSLEVLLDEFELEELLEEVLLEELLLEELSELIGSVKSKSTA